MSFNEEDSKPSAQSQKIGLKKPINESMFANQPKKPTQAEFEQKIDQYQKQAQDNKSQTIDLANKFLERIKSKTLNDNKSIFEKDIELDIIDKMAKLAMKINSDPDESEGIGSVSWIVLLLKIVLFQRNRINDLEYSVSKLEKNLDPTVIDGLVSTQVSNYFLKNKIKQ